MKVRIFAALSLALVPVLFIVQAGCGTKSTSTGSTTTTTTTQTTGSSAHSIPNYDHFQVAADKYLMNWAKANDTAAISVYLADRYGNGNVLTGTKVYFYAEAGATEASSAAVDSKGYATVNFRSQEPAPKTVTALTTWEWTLMRRLASEYGITLTYTDTNANGQFDETEPYTGTYHPSNGSGTVTITMTGEEAFTDTDGNGAYTVGEPFTDTIPEPFTDYNDNEKWDEGEFYVDVDNSKTWDGTKNGLWDSSKLLYREIRFTTSYGTAYVAFNTASTYTSSSGWTVASGSPKTFKVMVADAYFNSPAANTTIDVSTTVGTLSDLTVDSYPLGTLSATGTGAKRTYTVPNDFVKGPVEVKFTISSGGTTGNGTVTIAVTNTSGTVSNTLTGTVN